MATTVKTGWLNDNNGDKFAPKTLSSQVITNDGITLESKITSDLLSTKEEIVSSTTSQIATHNTNNSAHNDIRDLISGLTTNKVNVADIIDNLTTNVQNKPLSASQGVALKSLIDLLQTEVDANLNTLTNHTSNKSNPHGVTLSQLGVTATTSEVNVLDGITATTTELNYMDGVTSNVQTQLNGKAPSTHNHTKSQITDFPTTETWIFTLEDGSTVTKAVYVG